MMPELTGNFSRITVTKLLVIRENLSVERLLLEARSAAGTIDYFVKLPDIMIFGYPTGNVAYWQYLICTVSFIFDYINGEKNMSS